MLLPSATGGIGQPIAILLAQKGATLSLVGRDKAKLDALQATINQASGYAGGSVAYNIHVDLNETGASHKIAAQALRRKLVDNNIGVT